MVVPYNGFDNGVRQFASRVLFNTIPVPRTAFGRAVIEYPLVQETLADMRAEASAMVSVP